MDPSGKFFLILLFILFYIITFKNKKFNSKFIYIYAFIYVGYTEKQDALSAVSCSLCEMERVTAMNRLLY